MGATTVRCAASDNAGNNAAASFAVTVADRTAPRITPVVAGLQGSNGWYIGPVTVTWTVVDNESTATPCPTASTALNGSGQSFSCSSTSAGGVASASISVNVDQQAPSFPTCPATVALRQGQTLPQPAATDNLGVPVVTGAPAALPLGPTTVTWRATDQAGLSANCVQQVTVSVAVTETIAVTQASCQRVSATTGRWNVQGTSSIVANNGIQVFQTTASGNQNLSLFRPVSANGTWRWSVSAGPACTSPINLRSSATRTVRSNVAVAIR
jgi:hypothetical protein